MQRDDLSGGKKRGICQASVTSKVMLERNERGGGGRGGEKGGKEARERPNVRLKRKQNGGFADMMK